MPLDPPDPSGNPTDPAAAWNTLFTPGSPTFLDMARWLAALLVVMGHLRGLLMVDYHPDLVQGMVWRAFYFFTGFGREAVMVFFVLSGFLVGGPVLATLRHGGHFRFRPYLAARIGRLYAVLPLALLLGGMWDVAGYHLFNRLGYYDHQVSLPLIHTSFIAQLSLHGFLVNLFMGQTILGPTFGSNGPLWSLAYEFWYYLMGPLLALGVYSPVGRTRHLGLLVLLLSVLPAEMSLYFYVWLLGMVLPLLPAACRPWLPALLFLLALGGSRLHLHPHLGDWAVAVSFFLLLNALGHRRPAPTAPRHPFHRAMAGFSYSLYLLHFPMALFLVSLLASMGVAGVPMQPGMAAFLLYVALLSWLLLYAFALSRVSEREGLRAWLVEKVG